MCRLITVAVLFLTCFFLYLQTFVLPMTPRLVYGDQSIPLYQATRMLDGQLIYRDYDHFTTPGTDLVYMVLFKMFGVREWIPQAALIALGLSMVMLITLISKQLISGASAYLPGLLFVALPFSGYLDATHHWFSKLAAMGALTVLLRKRTCVRIMLAGVLIGVASFFTQSTGILVIGFALFLLWEWRRDNQPVALMIRKQIVLFASTLVTFAACMAYFVWKVGLKQILYHTVVFVVKYYPAEWFNTWRIYLSGRPHLHDLKSWPDAPAFVLIQLIVPFIYIAFFVRFAIDSRKRPDGRWNELMLVNLTGIFLFLTVASAPEWIRLYAVSAPALVLLVWFLESSGARGRSILQLLWLTVLAVFIARPLVTQLRRKTYLDLPVGRVAFFEPALYEECAWMAKRTRPLDYFFNDQNIAFALRLRGVGRVPTLRPTDYTRPEEVRDAIHALERFPVRFVSWNHDVEHDAWVARHPEGDHLDPMRSFLREHYHLAQTFRNGDQIWERNP